MYISVRGQVKEYSILKSCFSFHRRWVVTIAQSMSIPLPSGAGLLKMGSCNMCNMKCKAGQGNTTD